MSAAWIARGLMASDRDGLAELIAIYEGSAAYRLVWSHARKRSRRLLDRIDPERAAEGIAETRSAADAIAADLSQSTDALRLRLWCLLCSGLDLPPRVERNEEGIAEVCAELAEAAGKIAAKRRWDAAARAASIFSGEYWRKFGPYQLVPGRRPDLAPEPWDEMIEEFRGLVSAHVVEGAASLEAARRAAERALRTPPAPEAADGLGDLGEERALEVLAGGSGAAATYEIAELAAVVVAAKVSAKLIGGKAVLVTYAFLSDPLVLGPTALAITTLAATAVGEEIRRQISIPIACMLAIRGAATDGAPALSGLLERAPSLLPPERVRAYVIPRAPTRHAVVWTARRAMRAGGWLKEVTMDALRPPPYPGCDRLLASWEGATGRVIKVPRRPRAARRLATK